MDQKIVRVGRIAGLYGVRGWVKIYSYTSPPENILNLKPWYLSFGDEWQLTDFEGRKHGKGVVARVGDTDDRDVATKLLQTEIAVERSQLPTLARDEFYWADLEGLSVVTQSGQALGTVDHLLETGANDVLVVKADDRERLLPYIDSVVLRVDVDGGVIEVDWDPDF